MLNEQKTHDTVSTEEYSSAETSIIESVEDEILHVLEAGLLSGHAFISDDDLYRSCLTYDYRLGYKDYLVARNNLLLYDKIRKDGKHIYMRFIWECEWALSVYVFEIQKNPQLMYEVVPEDVFHFSEKPVLDAQKKEYVKAALMNRITEISAGPADADDSAVRTLAESFLDRVL